MGLAPFPTKRPGLKFHDSLLFAASRRLLSEKVAELLDLPCFLLQSPAKKSNFGQPAVFGFEVPFQWERYCFFHEMFIIDERTAFAALRSVRNCTLKLGAKGRNATSNSVPEPPAQQLGGV